MAMIIILALITFIPLSPHPSINGLDLPPLLLGVASRVECLRLNDVHAFVSVHVSVNILS